MFTSEFKGSICTFASYKNIGIVRWHANSNQNFCLFISLIKHFSIHFSISGLLSGLDCCSCRSIVQFFLSGLAICLQCTVFLVWPVTDHEPSLWAIVPAVILISFRWWENYISAFSILRKYHPSQNYKLNEFRQIAHCMFMEKRSWKMHVFLFSQLRLDV